MKRVGNGAAQFRYRQLAEMLRAEIRGGRYGPEDRLPTEAELARDFSLSRHTVRSAYEDLLADGLISRRAGRGTYVTPPGQFIKAVGRFEDLLGSPRDSEMEIVEPIRGIDDPEAAGLLGLESPAVHRVVVRRIHSGKPFNVTVISIPPDIGALLSGVPWLNVLGGALRETVIGMVDSLASHRVTVVRQVVRAGTADPKIASLLERDAGSTMLVIERLYLDEQGRAVEFGVNYLHPDRYDYRVEVRRIL